MHTIRRPQTLIRDWHRTVTDDGECLHCAVGWLAHETGFEFQQQHMATMDNDALWTHMNANGVPDNLLSRLETRNDDGVTEEERIDSLREFVNGHDDYEWDDNEAPVIKIEG